MIHCAILKKKFKKPTQTSGKMNACPLYIGQDISQLCTKHRCLALQILSVNAEKRLNPMEFLPFHTQSGNVSNLNHKMLNKGSKSYTGRQGGRRVSILCWSILKKQLNESFKDRRLHKQTHVINTSA